MAPSVEAVQSLSREASRVRSNADQHPRQYHAGKSKFVDLRGRAVDVSKTGGWKAVPFILGLLTANTVCAIIVFVLNNYLVTYYNQKPDKAAVISSDVSGTFYLSAVLGAFLADSYFGAFWTSTGGVALKIAGLALLILCSTYSPLQPGSCASNTQCGPAAPRYMAPLYAALYTACIGEGLVQPIVISLGAYQFDDSIPKEREEGTHYFRYVYFFIHLGLLIGLFPGVYLVLNVSPGWGFGFTLMFFVVFAADFYSGAFKYRYLRPSGSFLTRIAQVGTAALLKHGIRTTGTGSENLYDPADPPGSMLQKLHRTSKLKFLDRAAVISGAKDNNVVARGTQSWRLCSITQVEETKRLLQLLPIWVTSAFTYIMYSQLTTFTVQAGATLDRRWGSHFTLPAPSLHGFHMIISVFYIFLYSRLVVPRVRNMNNSPYGFKPLQRLGAAIFFAALTLVVGALIERKRLSVVREHHLQNQVLGKYVLPMKMWWLLSQYFVSALVELNLTLTSFEFYYHESSSETRTTAASFYYSAFALGYYFGSVLINIVNKVTRHQRGGSWLTGQLNNGGLEKYYWLLAVLLCIDFLAFLILAHRYQYNHNWSGKVQEAPPAVVDGERTIEPEHVRGT